MTREEYIAASMAGGHTQDCAQLLWVVLEAHSRKECYSLYVIASAAIAALDQIARKDGLVEGGMTGGMTAAKFAAWVLGRGMGLAAGLGIATAAPTEES